jgi:DUF4097 and DUF4098 domain-containing protein YvlB
MQSRYIPLLALGLAAALMASGCTVPDLSGQTEDIILEYPGEGIESLIVENRNGNVQVSLWDQDRVRIHAVKRTQLGGDELAKVNISAERGDNLTVRTVYRESPAQVSVDYTIQIPERLAAVHIESSNGAVEVDGVAGDTYAATSNGRVQVHNVSGDVEARTSNGEVDVRNAGGTVSVRSSNGRVIVLNASALSGIETSNGEIAAEILSLPGDVILQTSNGEINVALPAEGADAEIAADTSAGGRIMIQSVLIYVSEQTDTQLRGTIGNGGPTITLQTSNANIVISREPLTGY